MAKVPPESSTNTQSFVALGSRARIAMQRFVAGGRVGRSSHGTVSQSSAEKSLTLEGILEKLIAFPTASGDFEANNAALNYIESFLLERGMHINRYEDRGYGSLVASIHPDRKAPKVMLAAHIDVVPGPSELFTLRKDETKYYGRGVFDMKFAAACYLKLVDELKDELDRYDFGIMITTDEEIGSPDGINGCKLALEQGHVSKVCVLPDGGDNWKIEKFAKGIWRFDIIAEGKSAHGSRPWEGINAAENLMDALQEIRQLFTQEPESETINISGLSGGEARNQIPALVAAGIDIRYMNHKNLASLQEKVQAICEKYNAVIDNVSIYSPLENDPRLPLVSSFMTSIETITGKDCEPSMSYGATDGQYFGDRGIPCVIVRPEGGGAHSDEEWIDIQGFHEYKDVLIDYLRRVSS